MLPPIVRPLRSRTTPDLLRFYGRQSRYLATILTLHPHHRADRQFHSRFRVRSRRCYASRSARFCRAPCRSGRWLKDLAQEPAEVRPHTLRRLPGRRHPLRTHPAVPRIRLGCTAPGTGRGHPRLRVPSGSPIHNSYHYPRVKAPEHSRFASRAAAIARCNRCHPQADAPQKHGHTANIIFSLR